ncbi:UNVERIFIED_CONTAM: hypothetical protein NCL1_26441 [Trichonephila clavipes]
MQEQNPGRKETKPEVVERFRDSFLRSPSKSTRRAGAELTVPHTTVWRVLQKRLQFKPYRHQMVQALKPTDKPFRKNFCVKFQEHFDVNGFENTLVCTDEATFHLGGKVNRHNLRFGGMKNVHVTLGHQRDSPKVNVFCALYISSSCVLGPFFFSEKNRFMGTFTKTCSLSGCFPSWRKLFLISFCSKMVLPNIGIKTYVSS